MSKTYYVCKYTPIELLQAFGGECENLNQMPEGFDLSDRTSKYLWIWKSCLRSSYDWESKRTGFSKLL